ncbi:hypothetical protein WA026_007706 [Henosepilachna vigintioctopunctata]|uniref:Uncharacterized protein n=1 Tax=Henosepilachna vigintioctopunctata TaxID=420089 RepID=A0AAW1U301_9CUCU
MTLLVLSDSYKLQYNSLVKVHLGNTFVSCSEKNVEPICLYQYYWRHVSSALCIMCQWDQLFHLNHL